jgi:hypothetical protein
MRRVARCGDVRICPKLANLRWRPVMVVTSSMAQSTMPKDRLHPRADDGTARIAADADCDAHRSGEGLCHQLTEHDL